LWNSSAPTVPRRLDAPTTAIDRGARMAPTAATAAFRSRCSKRSLASGDSEVGKSIRITPGSDVEVIVNPQSRMTRIIR
jgi:hypothetical protein